MAGSERYWAIGATLPELISSLNVILGRLGYRLDTIQGIHGQPTIFASSLVFAGNGTTYAKGGFEIKDSTGTVIHSMGEV